MVRNRIRVLISAYACEPNKGSEPGVGWNWALQMAKTNEVYVITRSNNQRIIEDFLQKHPVEHLHFYYHDCTAWKRKMKKLPNGIFVYYKMWQKEILSIAKKIVESEKIDIIHHITFNEFRTPGKLYQLSIPFVWGPIGGGQFYNSIFKDAYFRRKDIFKEKLRNCINRFYLMFSHDIKVVVKKANTILIADQSTESIMPKSRKYVRLLETGYDLCRNEVKVYDENLIINKKRPIRLLWVGGIWPRKGLKVLIDALYDSWFDDYLLSVVGDGQDRKAAEKLVREYGLESKVEFLGKIGYNEVNGLYDNADIFIFTSLRDTSGNVVLEAMSHGLPVIAINHHGVGEIVTDETGIRIDPISYDFVKNGIVKAIKKYAENPWLMKQHGLAGRKRLETYYSWENNAKVLQTIYDEIIRMTISDEYQLEN